MPGPWPTNKLRLVDVGGAGGLQDKWLAHAGQVLPILVEPNPTEAAKLRGQLDVQYGGGVVLESGLSNVIGEQTLNIASFWGCTSLKQPNWDVLDRYRLGHAFRIIGTERIACTRYDALHAAGEVPAPDAIKIDVQGFEYEVLQGFGGLLQGCLGIELETHTYPLYHGERLMHELVAFLADFGFVLRNLRPVPSFDGDAVELDAWFTKDRRAWNGMDAAKRAKFSLICQAWGLVDYQFIDPAASHTQLP